MAVLVKLPFARRPWALPVLVALSRPPEWDRLGGTRHRTPAHLARLLLARLIRWFPERHFIFVGDSGYGTSETARFCRQRHRPLTVVSKFDGDAALYEPPPPRTRRTIGRPRVKGQNLAPPQDVVANTAKRTSPMVARHGEAPEPSRPSRARGTGTVLGKRSSKSDGSTSIVAQGLTGTSISLPRTSP